MTNSNERPRLIAITGGPCSGKSTFIESLRSDPTYAEQALFVPEAASLVLPGFLAVKETIDHHNASDWQRSLQLSITRLQYELEETYVTSAAKSGKNFVICDRGIRDAEAYTTDPSDIYASIGLTALSALHRYSGVLHMQSLAVSAPDLYENQSNPNRHESNAMHAEEVEQRTIQAWEGHPEWSFVAGGNTLKDKIIRAKTTLDTIVSR